MKSRVINALILSNAEISDGIYRITLTYDPLEGEWFAKGGAGQFVNLYLEDQSMLLPRPISIYRMETGTLSLVYRVVGKGTEVLAACKAGNSIRISTPLGHGFEIDEVFRRINERNSRGETIVIVAGGLGIPPMVELAKAIRKKINIGDPDRSPVVGNTGKIKLHAMIGFPSEPYLTEELMEFCDEVHIATENGSAGYQGNVLKMMEQQGLEGDYYLACGPKTMLMALAGTCTDRRKPLQISMEERMGCGYGACVGCTCKTKTWKDGNVTLTQKKVCKDGPVFFGEEVVWNE